MAEAGEQIQPIVETTSRNVNIELAGRNIRRSERRFLLDLSV